MYLMNLMNEHCMTRADLSMMSGVPDSTLRDILSGKAQIDHCAAATIYGIADALGTTHQNVSKLVAALASAGFVELTPSPDDRRARRIALTASAHAYFAAHAGQGEQVLDRLLSDALQRQQAADALLSIADRVVAAGIAPMSTEQISAEVKAARAERRQRAGGH